MAQEAEELFDLEKDFMLRLRLLLLGPREAVLLMTMHHIASDGESMPILFKDIVSLYTAFHGGASESPLPPIAVQYGDFAAWQREHLTGEVLERQEHYWRRRLADLPTLQLPTDRQRPPVQTFNGANASIEVPAEVVERLRRVALRAGASLYMATLAAFNVLLGQYSGQEDIVVGTPITNRQRAETQRLVGLFVNMQVMRTSLEGGPSFEELLQRVRGGCLDAYANQDIPFERLVEVLQPERDQSRQPLFQVMFMMHQMEKKEVEVPGLSISLQMAEGRIAKWDMSMICQEHSGGMTIDLEYNTDLFDRSTAERMLGHMRRALHFLGSSPAKPAHRVTLFSPAERHQLVAEWNDSARALPDRPLFALFERQAAECPDRACVVFGDEVLTYSEVNARANEVAHALIAGGVRPDSIVGVCVERSWRLPVALLGVHKAGGGYCPLDPSYPRERLVYQMEDTELGFLVAEKHLESTACAGHTASHVVLLDDFFTPSARAQRPKEWRRNPSVGVGLEHLFMCIYTSGSTGKPKGVQVMHRGPLNNCVHLNTLYQLRPGDNMLQFYTYSFDPSLLEFGMTLMTGATLWMAVKEQLLGPNLVRFMESNRIDAGMFPPALLKTMDHVGCPRLRVLVSAGEPCINVIIEKWAPGRVLINAYGPTECSCEVSWFVVPEDARYPVGAPAGRPNANLQLYIMDRYGNLLPIGCAGEIVCGGAQVSRGYLKRPELTPQVFVPNPFRPGEIMYRSGDLGRYLPDGNIDFLGRVDFQVKIRGFRVELGEIETRLAEHEQVHDALCLAVTNELGDRRLVAYILSPEHHETLTQAELQQWVGLTLPGYMVPSACIVLQDFPKGATGKYDRKKLPDPLKYLGAQQPGAGFEEPETETQRRVARIWGRLLGESRISASADFFDLGGHSLVAVRFITAVREEFGVDFDLRLFFDNPELRSVARVIDSAVDSERAPPLARVPRQHGAPLPCSFAQQRLWLLDQLEPGNTAYNVPAAVTVTGLLDGVLLRRALQTVTDRHETLRTTFAAEGEHPVQVVGPEGTPVALAEADLGALGPEEAHRRVQERVAREVNTPFDLAAGPLLRAVLLRLRKDHHVLVLVMHHIVSDGWSLGVLLKDLAGAYAALALCRPLALQPLPVQYADFAAWQREWLSGPVLERQLQYWARTLADLPTLQLPTRPRPPVQTFGGALAQLAVAPSVAVPLVGYGRAHGCTPFMTLLAVFQMLLSVWSGQEDIVVGTGIANRTRAETEGLIGFFVNMLVLRCDLSGQPRFAQLLGRVRRACLDAYAHQDVPREAGRRSAGGPRPQPQPAFPSRFRHDGRCLWRQAHRHPQYRGARDRPPVGRGFHRQV
eukprot:TRINITY_DN11792_c3_g1_i3.p1 TRINITY_DN11792_c3_g1~~TRINITY_DN11792_c3_g1_i3.p1  ORF type:complete len:1441 (+),score=544.22 TRINITY_DN11792_c3_g1_i3:278-4324(+)